RFTVVRPGLVEHLQRHDNRFRRAPLRSTDLALASGRYLFQDMVSWPFALTVLELPAQLLGFLFEVRREWGRNGGRRATGDGLIQRWDGVRLRWHDRRDRFGI